MARWRVGKTRTAWEFRHWFRQTPAGTAGCEVALWAGLSVLGYLGGVMERRSLLDRGWVRVALGDVLENAPRAVEPGDLTMLRVVLSAFYRRD